MMVGVNISDEQLGSIADRTIQEADTNGDSCISFSEFIKVKSSALSFFSGSGIDVFWPGNTLAQNSQTLY